METQITCEAFADRLANGDFFDDYIQNAHWEQNFSTEECLNKLVHEASKRNVQLIDLDDFDYDKYFDNMYRCTERGLS